MTIIENLKAKIVTLQEKIKEIQAECSHPLSAREFKHDGSSGNYCPSDDCYWTNHHCILCDLRWTTEQGWQNLYSGAGKGMPGWKPNKGVIMEDYTETELYDLLKQYLAADIVNVNFVKKNGDVRSLLCTTNPDKIPEESLSFASRYRRHNPEVQIVWDIQSEDWRSFRFDRVVAFFPCSMSESIGVPNVNIGRLFVLRSKQDILDWDPE